MHKLTKIYEPCSIRFGLKQTNEISKCYHTKVKYKDTRIWLTLDGQPSLLVNLQLRAKMTMQSSAILAQLQKVKFRQFGPDSSTD